MTQKEAHYCFELLRLHHTKELRKRFGFEAELHARTAKDEVMLAGCAAIEHGADARDLFIAITEQISQNNNLVESLSARLTQTKKKSRKKKS